MIGGLVALLLDVPDVIERYFSGQLPDWITPADIVWSSVIIIGNAIMLWFFWRRDRKAKIGPNLAIHSAVIAEYNEKVERMLAMMEAEESPEDISDFVYQSFFVGLPLIIKSAFGENERRRYMSALENITMRQRGDQEYVDAIDITDTARDFIGGLEFTAAKQDLSEQVGEMIQSKLRELHDQGKLTYHEID